MAVSPAPPKKTGKKGGESDSQAFSAARMVQDYLELCADPSKDLQRWFAEDKKKPFFRATQQSRHDRPINAAKLFRNALQELSDRVGAQNDRGQNLPHVPDRQGTGVAGLERVRHVQASGAESLARPGSAQDSDITEEAHELGRAFDELSLLVSKHLEAAAKTTRKHEFAAAKRAILAERDRAAQHLVEEFKQAQHARRKQDANRPEGTAVNFGEARAAGPPEPR